ncbi:MAG: hypothetical protein HYU86_00830 [Chloroflexi bacterium]|nr:hypothetical protein [Chloroflexota bacterium]
MTWVIVWWLWAEVLGLLALPLTFLLFRNLPDRGYVFSKAFGLLLISYLLWLGAFSRLLPNSRGTLFLLLWVVGLGSLLALRTHRHQLASFLRANLGLVTIAEGVFLLAFLLMTVVRAYNPEIQHTEQLMDFAFLNGVFQSPFFPPVDPWLSGYSISYYYFGYLMMAAVTKLTLIDTAVAYNLALPLLFALTAVGAFGLVYNMIRLSSPGVTNKGTAMGFGLIAVLFVLGIGNLEGALELLYAHGWGTEGFWRWVSIKGLTEPYQSATWYPTQSWWWWRATRVIDTLVDSRSIDYTITEFPFFSFLLGDLHPHLMALPFGLMGLGLALQAMASGQGREWLRSHPLVFLGVALSMGALGFLNSWDLITFLIIFLAAIALSSWREEEPFSWRKYIPSAILVTLIAFVLFIPFYWSFRSQVGGILPVRGVSTRPFHYLLIWGFFLFLGLSLAVSLVRKSLGKAGLFRLGLAAGGVVATPWLVWSGIELAIGLMQGDLGVSLSAVAGKLGSLWPLMIVLTFLLVLVVRANEAKGLTFALLLLWGGVFLTYLCELFFVLDFFGNRMNTVFKIYYQVWLLLAISGAFALYYVSQKLRATSLPGLLWRGGVATLLAASLFYPVAALYSKTDGFRSQPILDGLAFAANNNAGEAEAIHWLKDNVLEGSVVVEATGGDYSEYGRIAGRTGLPTILGWPGHELQWRGSSRPFQGRAEDVAEIYRTTDGARQGSIIDKYGVSYIYLGPLERKTYGIQSLGVLPPFLGVAFQKGEVTIYRVLKRNERAR